MKLYLKVNLPKGKKCGHRDPKTNAPIKNIVLFPNEPTEVDAKIAKLMLEQNPHIISKEPYVPPGIEPGPTHDLNANSNTRARLIEVEKIAGDLETENVDLKVSNKLLRERIEELTSDKTEKTDPEADQVEQKESDKNVEIAHPTEFKLETDLPAATKESTDQVKETPLEDLKMNELYIVAERYPAITIKPAMSKLDLIAKIKTAMAAVPAFK